MHRITWALFQNDEDGPYGIYPHTTLGAVCWWFRNPFHNLLFHVINWPSGPFFKWGKVPGWNGYIGFRPPSGAFGIALRYEKNK